MVLLLVISFVSSIIASPTPKQQVTAVKKKKRFLKRISTCSDPKTCKGCSNPQACAKLRELYDQMNDGNQEREKFIGNLRIAIPSDRNRSIAELLGDLQEELGRPIGDVFESEALLRRIYRYTESVKKKIQQLRNDVGGDADDDFSQQAGYLERAMHNLEKGERALSSIAFVGLIAEAKSFTEKAEKLCNLVEAMADEHTGDEEQIQAKQEGSREVCYARKLSRYCCSRCCSKKKAKKIRNGAKKVRKCCRCTARYLGKVPCVR